MGYLRPAGCVRLDGFRHKIDEMRHVLQESDDESDPCVSVLRHRLLV